jgi:predicted DNA-binding protein
MRQAYEHYEKQPDGGGRVRRPRQQPVSFKAPQEIREQIVAMANATGMSRGGVIKAAIAAHYEQMVG